MTKVIILAQGAQKRLPNLGTAKQLLRLHACNMPIIQRTIHQVDQVFGTDNVTVVGRICDFGHLLTPAAYPCVDILQLGNPGNSSLKGVRKALVYDVYARYRQRLELTQDTVILLGDVVYSWACLEALRTNSSLDFRFVGSSDLSQGGGELWGLSWGANMEHMMVDALEEALLDHPPFSEYQPGQMRRWLWQINVERSRQKYQLNNAPWFTAIDDYTMDVDLPEHVHQLGAVSEYARADDLAHGWSYL